MKRHRPEGGSNWRSTFGNASMEILKEAMSSCFSRPFNSPSIIDKYWETVRARNTTFENTIACVTAAYETAYGDQIAKFSHLMISALRDGLVPHQPQATPLRLIRLLTANREDTIVRLVRFATLLPGFRDLSDGDQRILIAEKLLMSYLLHLSKYFYKGEHYFILPGPDNVHCSRSVMDSLGLDQDYLHFVESSMARLNSIGLTLPETYLLLAAAIFYPGIQQTCSKAKSALLRCFSYSGHFHKMDSPTGHRRHGSST
ncbi:uncharacterized protein LOC129601141 [Paramacrobiotus metropolitanus]|uniref:uncharacterized protein LOC129601141 n=1 Tax=Paramacrobiotus metropolitanus TaxID=2943436 RepID=UPI0024463745|nr:uncharacterized protein LOC129601141 [Paramacrobiotus metropolitanus]